ncbi:unnamed protein product [Clonostachys rhizophaga]|uniref:Uncharacterized protein n=1 Tax=Clonostachys rhizophaga TaxID=160324 RepID=A0A9N9YED4_9HYPO|nr:unnamed protein product [Clonostachys rhizophaga]
MTGSFEADVSAERLSQLFTHNATPRHTRSNHLFGVLGTESLGGVDKVDEGLLGLLPLAGLETAVRVDPELLRLEVSKHFLDAVLDLLLAGNTRGVDVVDTRANVARVSLVDEDLEELGVRLAVLDRENISVKSSNSMEEVLELRVAEVRVDLSVVLDTSSAESESLDGPVEVGSALLAGAERETLTESRLIDLDDTDTGVLEVNNLVAESKSKLLSLDGLVNVVTRERPSEAGDGASKHTLHGLLRNGDGIFAFLDSHRSRSGDVTDDDRRTDAARSVRLDPGVGGEGIAVQALTEELNHVVTLGLTVDKDIKVKLFLDLDVLLNLLLDELVVLSLGDFALGEAVTLETDLLGLREGTNSGGREEGKVELLLLKRNSGWELRLALVVSVGDLGLAVLDLGVVGAAGRGTSLERLGVGLELLTDGSRALSDGLGNNGDLNSLLGGEREPVGNLSVELLLASESVGSVEERAGGGGDDTVLAELLNSSLDGLNSTLEVGLPDVTAVDNTGREDSLGAQSANHLIELLGVTDKVDVDGVDVLGENIQVVDDVTEVGGEDELGDLVAEAGELLVSRLEGCLGLGREVKDQSGLVNLDGLGTSLFELDKKLLIDGQKSIEKVNGVDGLVTVGLSEVEERDGTDEDGAGLDASLLGLVESGNSLGLVSELEGLAVLESGLDVVVVGVKPLDHLQARNVNAVLLVATAHGEVLVDEVKTILGVAGRDGL